MIKKCLKINIFKMILLPVARKHQINHVIKIMIIYILKLMIFFKINMIVKIMKMDCKLMSKLKIQLTIKIKKMNELTKTAIK